MELGYSDNLDIVLIAIFLNDINRLPWVRRMVNRLSSASRRVWTYWKLLCSLAGDWWSFTVCAVVTIDTCILRFLISLERMLIWALSYWFVFFRDEAELVGILIKTRIWQSLKKKEQENFTKVEVKLKFRRNCKLCIQYPNPAFSLPLKEMLARQAILG